MPKILFIEADGTRYDVEAEVGQSAMQAAVNNNVRGIAADCGGALSCATCHSYVDPEWLPRLSPAEDMEKEMLQMAFNPQPNSRLSCQIHMSDELDGLVLRLPETQY